MSNFEFLRECKPLKSFRVASVMGKFDIQSEHITEVFKGEINLPVAWNIGLIVGKSGSGKSTIANELFKDILFAGFQYNNQSILDDMPSEASIEDISMAFNSVGLSSPPSWLKPYSALSNGEKMRCDLARCILSNQQTFAFDEFTSVVDRQVGKIGSFAIQKAVRKQNRQFIAITCHYDVEEWLLPDWVFNTDTMTFQVIPEEQKKNRPELNLKIFKTTRKSEYWRMFSRYHYLSHSHNNSASVYIATIDDRIAGFISVAHFPHPSSNKIKKVHRLIVFPDYQGIGIGIYLLNEVGNIYKKAGFKYSITTSSPSLVFALKKHPDWRCLRFGRTRPHKGLKSQHKGSSDRITVSYEYILSNG